MKRGFSILLFFTIFFVACNDNKIDSSIISTGAIMSDEAKEIEQNLDKASYAELADLFLDTKSIDFNKEVLIIFGKNNCTYCDILKKTIKEDETLKQMIKDNFNSYYVNTSYTKTHTMNFMNKVSNIETIDLATIFRVNSTPLVAFLSVNGDVKYIYPGYTPQFKDLVVDVIQKKSSMGSYADIDSSLQNL